MEEIKQWLDSERNYDEGARIFAKYSKNKIMARTFLTRKEQYYGGKLAYEMSKLVKLPRPSQRVVQPIIMISPVRADRKDYLPPVISAIKKEIASLYNLIDKMHGELYDLGTSNAADVVAARKRLLDKRKPACFSVDVLYHLKEEYFRTTGKEQQSVVAEMQKLITPEPSEHPLLTTRVSKAKRIDMSDLQLMKRKQAVASSITKTQNILQYQSVRKEDKETPLPEGPKREHYIKKLNDLKAEYDAIIKEIRLRTK